MCNFDDAFKYFKLSDIKPRTIISFFSDYQIPEWNIQGIDVREIIRKHNADTKGLPLCIVILFVLTFSLS
jgi:hypothetical protein